MDQRGLISDYGSVLPLIKNAFVNMDLSPYRRTFQPDASSSIHTHTHTHIQIKRTRVCVWSTQKTDIPPLFFLFFFFEFQMYFDIFVFFLPKEEKKTKKRAINCQTVVVTSLKTASLDHSKLTRVPQIDISCSAQPQTSANPDLSC